MTDQGIYPATAKTAGEELSELYDVIKRLRSPDGCPWDREQTIASLKPSLLEETYELLEAMEGSVGAHAEELGDVLLQVVFQTAIRDEQGEFDLADVIRMLNEKLVRRHPHVFGTDRAATTAEVLRKWEAIKRDERAQGDMRRRSAMAGVPAQLPALARAQRVQSKASRVGFDWSDQEGPSYKINEELAELREAIASGEHKMIEEEVGDLLFSIVNLCRFTKVDAEEALRKSTGKFIERFQFIERTLEDQGREIEGCSLEELDEIWNRSKKSGQGTSESS